MKCRIRHYTSPRNAPKEAPYIQNDKIGRWKLIQPTDLIVVDNGSEDETVQIAKAHGATVLKLPNANIGELRNFGASFGKGDIYAFLDADCVPDRDWLRIAVEKLKDNQIEFL